MFSAIKKVLVAGALVLATAVGFSTTATAQSSTFTVFNRSSYRINHLYVSSTVTTTGAMTDLAAISSTPTIVLTWQFRPAGMT